MQRGLLIGIASLMMALGVAFLVMTRGASNEDASASPEKPTLDRSTSDAPAGSNAADRNEPPARSGPESIAAAEAAWQRANAEHREAIADREEAERLLDDLGRELDAVEGFVEDLQERGEDPARHAFEAMEKLNPIIERYEARSKALEAADAREEAAAARLERARIALDAMERP